MILISERLNSIFSKSWSYFSLQITEQSKMAFVEILIFVILLAGSTTTIVTLLTHCNGGNDVEKHRNLTPEGETTSTNKPTWNVKGYQDLYRTELIFRISKAEDIFQLAKIHGFCGLQWNHFINFISYGQNKDAMPSLSRRC